MKTGDWVCIKSVGGRAARLLRPYAAADGVWCLDRRIDGLFSWSEDDMRPATRDEVELARRMGYQEEF